MEEVLIRIDERTLRICQDIDEIKTGYVTQTEFKPVKKIVYGGVSFVLFAVIGAVVGLVLVR